RAPALVSRARGRERASGSYLNSNAARSYVPSVRRATNCRHVPAQALSVSQRLTAPVVRNRRAAVAAERLRPQLYAGRRLPALVLGAVDHPYRALDDVLVEPVARQFLERTVVLDVLLEHFVELRIRRQRILVELVVSQFRAGRAVDDRLRDQLLVLVALVQVARELEDVRLV